MLSIVLLVGLFSSASCTPIGRRDGPAQSKSFKSLQTPILAPYYMYFGNDDTPTLSKARDDLGMDSAIIGFASAPKGKCSLTTDLDGLQQNMNDFIAKGGATAISFGGNLNDQTVPRQHIQQACSDEGSLAKLIKDSMTKFNTHNIDFDIEDNQLLKDLDAAKRLASALSQVKKDIPDTFVMYTLGTGTGGMPQDQLNWLQAAKDNGLQPDIVSLMTMNMGGKDNVQDSQGAITGGAKQVSKIFGISLEDATKKMGMIPSIGVDNNKVVVDLDDTKTLATFAQKNQLALQSMWNFNRDFPGGKTTPQELGTSSSPDQKEPQQFFKTMHGVLAAGDKSVSPASVKNVEDSKNKADPNASAISNPGQKAALPAAGANGGTPGTKNN